MKGARRSFSILCYVYTIKKHAKSIEFKIVIPIDSCPISNPVSYLHIGIDVIFGKIKDVENDLSNCPFIMLTIEIMAWDFNRMSLFQTN